MLYCCPFVTIFHSITAIFLAVAVIAAELRTAENNSDIPLNYAEIISKWAKMTKCSPDTALRDIKDLLERGILKQHIISYIYHPVNQV